MIVNYSWPKGWRNYVITEGIEDIGLPDYVLKRLKDNLGNADPAAQTYVGNLWKARTFLTSNTQYGEVGRYYNDVKSGLQYLEEFIPDGEEKDNIGRGWRGITKSFEHQVASYGKLRTLAKKLKKQALIVARLADESLDMDKISAEAGEPMDNPVPVMLARIDGYIDSMYETAAGKFLRDPNVRELVLFLNDRTDNWDLVKRYNRGVYEKYLYEDWWASAVADARESDPGFSDPDQSVRNAAANKLRKEVKALVKEDPYVQRIRKAKGLPDVTDRTFNEFIKFQTELAAEGKNEVLRFEEDDEGREYFWVDLQTRHCPIEAARMGHCGHAGSGTMFSLRYKPPGARLSRSVVTLEYDADNNVIHQIKGNSNTVPEREYWDYISSFVDEFAEDGVKVVERGEHSDDDPDDWREMGEAVTDGTHGYFDPKGNQELLDMTEKVDNGDYDTKFISFSAEYDEDGYYEDRAMTQVSVTVNIPFKIQISEGIQAGYVAAAMIAEMERLELYREGVEEGLTAFLEYYEDELLGPNGETPGGWVSNFLEAPRFYLGDAMVTGDWPDWSRSLKVAVRFAPMYEDTLQYDADELESYVENVAYDFDDGTIETMSKKLSYYLASFIGKYTGADDPSLANMKNLMQRIQKLDQENDNVLFELGEEVDFDDDYEEIQLEMAVEGLEFDVRFDSRIELFKENPTHSEDWDKESAYQDQLRILQLLQAYMFNPQSLGKKVFSDHIQDAAEKAESKQTQLSFGKKHGTSIEFRKPSDMSIQFKTYGLGEVIVAAKFEIGFEKTPSLTKEDVDGIMKYFEAIIEYGEGAAIRAMKDSMEFLHPRKKSGALSRGLQIRQLLDSAELEFAPDWIPKVWRDSAGQTTPKPGLTEGKRRKMKIRMRRR